MSMDDRSFVKGFFLTIAWFANTGPIVYALIQHDWLYVGLLVIASMGVAVHIAAKDAD